MTSALATFAEKYQLARQAALRADFHNGAAGFELEYNLLDADFKPLLTVGAGPDQRSFVDYLRAQVIPAWLVDRSQLEVFHWMIEWATVPYFSPLGAVYEARLLEAALYNALAQAGREFGEKLTALHGNLLYPARVGHDSIPSGWNLAKRRYLERCVDLFGSLLATAGIHTNLSLPEPLLSWDFMHQSASERGEGHLDAYKNRVYIDATRRMRAFTPLFIATSASTPFRAERRDGEPVILLTEVDSNRLATFPNPPTLDVPGLYRSHADYLHASYDLVRSGARFGNNNWTPVRARSSVEPVERLIRTTSDQLHDIYQRGLYAAGRGGSAESMAREIERENLLARINIPMARVEIRTDEGGHPLDLDLANVTLKHLLLLRFYADPAFANEFAYDAAAIRRARRNEHQAAQRGLRAELTQPLTGKRANLREFLRWTLAELRPLAEALEVWQRLQPLVAMAQGAPNTAERLRARMEKETGKKAGAEPVIPVDLVKAWAAEREVLVRHEVEAIAADVAALGDEAPKIREFLQRARDDARHDPLAPIRFRPRAAAVVAPHYADKPGEVLDLARQLIRIPSITNCPEERLDEVHRAATFIFDYMREAGLEVKYYDRTKYPAVFAAFPGRATAAAMLGGHFDVVPPEPDDSQFEPRLEGDYLWGRGAADMKTVVATFLVWMKDTLRAGPPFPRVNLLLVGNEENGEREPTGTPHALAELAAAHGGYLPELFIAGERTGEQGDELMGEVCIENRGVLRFEVSAHGLKGHTGIAGAGADLSDALLAARSALSEIFQNTLTLQAADGWRSQYRFPFINLGEPGVFNITADRAVLGVEVRPIPQDNLQLLNERVQAYCAGTGLNLTTVTNESGVACNRANRCLLELLAAVREAYGQEPRLGKKLPGTSARFAPGGQGVVWGQSGLGPHARDERHFIPSIAGYYRALEVFGRRLR